MKYPMNTLHPSARVLTLLAALTLGACASAPGDQQAVDWTPPEGPPPVGPVIDCEGGTLTGKIVIDESGTTLQNCRVEGSVRIQGCASNGEAKCLTRRSGRAGYVDWIRAQAPSHVTIRNVQIVTTGRIPLYLAPGVTFAAIDGVTLSGRSDSVMLYLDAESSRNVIRNSVIDARKGAREAIAIDASDHNLFEGNVVIESTHGGAYFYRNCGEGGTTRHTTPSDNVLRGNTFIATRTQGAAADILPDAFGDPSVWFSHRDGLRAYCVLDDDRFWGSGLSNEDHARRNILENNELPSGVTFGWSARENVIQ